MQRPPVLLTNANHYGTLAAVRCLGRAGVPVTIADAEVLAPARWSRFATRRLTCPSVDEPEAFVDWLAGFGEREPGHVVYASGDDVAWLLSADVERLAPHFKLLQAPLAVLRRLLDKRELFAACAEVGIPSPTTYFPDGPAMLAEIARVAEFPVLLKPTTQVLHRSHTKGATVDTAAALPARYQAFRATNQYHPMVLAQVSGVERPMVQSYLPQAARGIYSVAGFVDQAEGGGLVALAATKVLQRPRRLGIGLCFEEAPLERSLVDALERFCRRLGYSGVFEVEFIQEDGRFLLIDFNPRFYSQMAFEVDRGLPLPLIAYEAALGRHDALAAARATLAARAASPRPPRVYTHRAVLWMMTRAQRLVGTMSAEEVASWEEWYRRHRGNVSDAVADPDDWLPALVDFGSRAVSYGRHPRSFVRTMVFDR